MTADPFVRRTALAAAVAAPLTGVAAVVSWLVGSASLAFAGRAADTASVSGTRADSDTSADD